MIVVHLSSASVARTSVRPSPMHELVGLLRLARRRARHPILGELGQSAYGALRVPEVALAACLLSTASYQPDFLTPQPPAEASFSEIFEAQLASVADAPPDVVADEHAEWLRTAPDLGARTLATVAELVERGGLHTAAHQGLVAFHQAVDNDLWQVVQQASATASRHTAQRIGDRGLAGLFETLHPDLSYSGGDLFIERPFDETVEFEQHGLVLVPVVAETVRLWVQVCTPSDASIAFPAGAYAAGDGSLLRSDRGHLDDLLGRTRAQLLADLSVPHTPTSLSKRHSLAKATVAHHLKVLARAGLVTRNRNGATVEYTRTARADLLLSRPGYRSA